MLTLNRSALVVIPKSPFLRWLHSVDPTSSELGLDNLREDPTIYLLDEYPDDAAAAAVVREVFAEIFEEQLAGWWQDPAVWPANRTFDLFCEWFEYQLYSELVDLSSEPLMGEDL